MKSGREVLIMHAYSAGNLGDGLLVDEAVTLLREAYGDDIRLTLVARDPVSFKSFPGRVLASLPSASGLRQFVAVARAVHSADVVVGVGGAYARGDTTTALLKYAIVHLTQTLLIGARNRGTIYLPQSVGPFHPLVWPLVRATYRRIGYVALRDDRSVAELRIPNALRLPDSAIFGLRRPSLNDAVEGRPVVSVRRVSMRARPRLETLARLLGEFDGYVQSATLGNDDRSDMRNIGPVRTLSQNDLLGPEAHKRVVVAVRLHAALMALRSGHYVIHLAYERKGFGAFQDLGLPDYCHNVNAFDPDVVVAQVQELLTSQSARNLYNQRLNAALIEVPKAHEKLIVALRTAANLYESGAAEVS